ncbi:MAG: large-conductance mechanosensitive channel protein MscL [Bacteroidota bacterium]
MSFTSEFRDFISKGNVVDLAVGVVIGGAFGKIIDSLVNDILMPPLGLIIGGVDFKDLKIAIQAASVDAAGKVVPAVTINYGMFIQAAITFLLIALAVFMFVVKPMNAMRKRMEKNAEPAAPAGPPPPTKDQALLTEIRDLLKK